LADGTFVEHRFCVIEAVHQETRRSHALCKLALRQWHDPIVAGPWFKIALTETQVAAWHISRLEEAFGVLFVAAGSPSAAALFGLARGDGGEDLYFTPPAVALAQRLLKANGAGPSDALVDDGTAALLVGDRLDMRLLHS
jgi:hypothetical protein